MNRRNGCTSVDHATTNTTTHHDINTTETILANGLQRSPVAGGASARSAGASADESHGENGGTEQTRDRVRPKRTRASLKIATLNMRGYGEPRPGQMTDKWMCINQIVRDERVAILALQETHLTAERVERLNDLFAATMLVYGSFDEVNPTGARGVAFVVNKRLINTDNVTFGELEPGRAVTLRMKWTNGERLRIINVYAPNVASENTAFWACRLAEGGKPRAFRPDMIVGDFNMVEDAIDRLPPHRDTPEQCEALQRFLRELSLSDSWRARHPGTRMYTYLQQATGSQSRIDRIYTTRDTAHKAMDWEVVGPGISTDHRMLVIGLTNAEIPYQGKGRWALPPVLLSDAPFLKTMKELGKDLQTQLERQQVRTHTNNPQVAYASFKHKLVEAARRRARQCVPKIERAVQGIRKDIAAVGNAENMGDEEKKDSLQVLQNRLAELETRRFGAKRRTVAANDWARGETICKYWTKLNAGPKPSTLIYSLGEGADGQPIRYTKRSDEMASIAMEYYNGLQADPDLEKEQQAATTASVLDEIEATLTETQAATIGEQLSTLEVMKAIREAASGKAPGLDGLPSEIWKTYLRQYETDVHKKRPAFSVATALAAVYNDIAQYGMLENSRFAEGWICPIYKLKKDKRNIANYRPITLLNSDYKLMTRALAMRVARVADALIHTDQAGFVPGRQIFAQIRLTQLMIDYAEAEEVNGMIVALDQEKAYDRIDHTYLWATLRAYGLPNSFIRTVRNLYDGAMSIVIVNGEKSTEFRITRGVRQGDPMSCLLFNLAIEPLASMLRRSSLRGFNIPGVRDRILAALFADDTVVYLHEDDDYGDLVHILRKWCSASRAKFNEEKTDHIPVGTLEFRTEAAQRTAMARVVDTLPPNARFVPEGAAIRSLGAWVGNNADGAAPWEAIVSTVQHRLDWWGRRKPTVAGRKLIVSMEVGGRTQFLTKAQGMPENILNRLVKVVADFVWKGDKHPRISRDVLYGTIAEGGIGLLDIKARNDAAELVWMRDYLDLTPARPRWAFVADVLMASAVMAADRAVERKARVNTFLQTWRVSTRAAAGLPETLKRMLKAAEKYGLRANARNPDILLKEQMPVWYHLGRDGRRSAANSSASRCLRDKHGVVNVMDCMRVARRTYRLGTHRPVPQCKCDDCTEDRTARDCDNPARCALAARKALECLKPIWRTDNVGPDDGLSLTRRRLDRNHQRRAEKGRVTFNPSIREAGTLATLFRVFTDAAGLDIAVRRPPGRFDIPGESIEVFTDGSCDRNGETNARAGSGIWFGRDDPRNVALRVPGETQTNQTGELFAIAAATHLVPPFVGLHIVTDSKYAADGLTVHADRWEQRGWKNVANAAVFQDVLARLRHRSAETTFRWVKGHDMVEGNEGADVLAKLGADREEPMTLPPAPREYLRVGMALSGLTQKMAYQGVRAELRKEDRQATRHMVDRVLASILHAYGTAKTETALWNGIRHKDVARSMRDFWWKATHDALRIGRFWENIPGYEERALCGACATEESLEHIILECDVPGQRLIWKLVGQLLQKKAIPEVQWNLGAVLGATLAPFPRDGDRPPTAGQRRLFKIVVTEATHMIWKLRCTRVIEHGNDPEKWLTEDALRAKWLAALNRRLAMDQALTSKRLGSKGVDRAVVLDTWAGLLVDEHDLPDDWIGRPGVLVGMPPRNAEQGVG